jgi:hypothetical protein
MKPKVKAKRYWKTASGSYLYPDKKAAQYYSGFHSAKVTPVAVLPADAESVAAMVEQVKKAWLDADESEHIDDMARITLAAIGIKGGAK